MITRHWYDHAAVGEALFQVAGAYRDPLRKQKLLFWTYELVLSEEWAFLWAILERVALRWGNSDCLNALETTSTDALHVLHFLHVLLLLPSFVAVEPPPADCREPKQGLPGNLPTKPATWTVAQKATLWWAVHDALQKRRCQRLLALLGSLPCAVAATYLGVVAKGGEKGIFHLLEMAGFSTLPTVAPSACASTSAIKWPDIPVGRVAARLFALPRTLVPKGPVDPLATRHDGCAFWRRVWSACDDALPESEEAIWNTYFPDDIPDEWSAAEQAKSHITLP